MAKLRLKLRKAKKKDQRLPRVDVEKLKNPNIKKLFQLDIKNRLSVLQDQQRINLPQFDTALLESSQRILGPRRKSKEGVDIRKNLGGNW